MKLNNQKMLELVQKFITSNKNIKWSDLFSNEDEMLDKMLEFKKLDSEIMKNSFYGVSKNVWLEMIEKAKKNNWVLTDKQVKQVKRNVYIIVKQFNIYDESARKKLIEILNK